MNAPAHRYSPLGQLVLARMREFYREPEAIFWVYGFPILMTIALGIAFRNRPVEQIRVDIVAGAGAEEVRKVLDKSGRFLPETHTRADGEKHLRTGKVDLVIVPQTSGKFKYTYLYSPSRPESRLARDEVDNVLQAHEGRVQAVEVDSVPQEGPGSSYIEFLVPGLLGMGLMGGGLWGLGFVTVDMRIRKLLKRFLATPMRKADFLASLMISRLIFMVPEVLMLLVFAYFAFGVGIAGSVLAVLALILLGAFTFAGIGLLVASRARTMEAVSGLMNLVMLPMWVFSGVFFSSERFPEALQGFIKLLPLTPLNNALRAVMLDGLPLASQWAEILILLAWGVITFALALRWFRWN